MTREELIRQIREKKSMLCVGLDTDLEKISRHLLEMEDPPFVFNKAIIDATAEHCVAYKLNTAFYEAHGAKGWVSLEKTIRYIRENHPDHFIIADAKRGDIGNTASRYARAFFDELDCDAITVAPYMGEDSVKPFGGRPGKWVIVLGLTSNPGANDVQRLETKSGAAVYTEVMDRVGNWLTPDELMFVVGATRPEELAALRARFPRTFFLVPGVGAQGGNAADVVRTAAIPNEGGLLINASRSIIYASRDVDFALAAGEKARQFRGEMREAGNEISW